MTAPHARLHDRPTNPILLIDSRVSRFAGARLRWKRYRRWTVGQECACEFCGAGFTEAGSPGLVAGYSIVGGGPAGQDDFRWICAICYESFREFAGWIVLDTVGRPIEPMGLWEAAFGFEAEPEDRVVARP